MSARSILDVTPAPAGSKTRAFDKGHVYHPRRWGGQRCVLCGADKPKSLTKRLTLPKCRAYWKVP
jgi:hypothetical protein